jgi:hypothetical protein
MANTELNSANTVDDKRMRIRSSGCIVISGPTGSGKTSKLIAFEDPVEFRIPGAAPDPIRKFRKNGWRGFIALEKLGAIVGYTILTVAAVLLVQQIITYANYIRASNQVDNMVTAVRTTWSGQAGFTGLDNSALRTNIVVPPDLIDPNSATGIQGVFGPITIAVNATDSSAFDITLAGVSSSVCTRMARNRSGGAQYAGVIAVSMNGGADIVAFPVTPAQSGAGCSVSTSAGNTIRWTYR